MIWVNSNLLCRDDSNINVVWIIWIISISNLYCTCESPWLSKRWDGQRHCMCEWYSTSWLLFTVSVSACGHESDCVSSAAARTSRHAVGITKTEISDYCTDCLIVLNAGETWIVSSVQVVFSFHCLVVRACTRCLKKFLAISRKNCRIFKILGRSITKKVSNQKVLYFLTLPNSCSCTTLRNWKHGNFFRDTVYIDYIVSFDQYRHSVIGVNLFDSLCFSVNSD